MKSVPQGGIKWRPGGEILWNSRQVGSRNMRVGKRSICGIMAGILVHDGTGERIWDDEGRERGK